MDPIEFSQRRPITPSLLDREAARRGGLAQPVPTPTPTVPSLKALLLSSSTLPEGSATGTLVGTLDGKTDGSTLTLLDDAGGRFRLSGLALEAGPTVTDYESGTSYDVTVRETLSGADNSPRDTVVAITIANVLEQPSLGALTLSASSLSDGEAGSIEIAGATAGSTLSVAGGTLPSGMALNGDRRTITGTPTTPQTANFTLRETLDDSPNSPRDTALTVTITAVDRTAPRITSDNPSGTHQEGTPIGGKLTADEAVTWSKSGADAARVTLDTKTGVWSLESTDYETKTSYSWAFGATDAANNVTRQDVAITIANVAEKPSLGALSLSSASLPQAAAASITINGATAGSELAVTGGTLPQGMALNSTERTIAGRPTTPQTASFTLRETLADSPNSPRDTALSLTVTKLAQPGVLRFQDASGNENTLLSHVGARVGGTDGPKEYGWEVTSGAEYILGPTSGTVGHHDPALPVSAINVEAGPGVGGDKTYTITLTDLIGNDPSYTISGTIKDTATAPIILPTSGTGGYAGSVYEAAPGDGSTSGQWYADGVAIFDATALQWTMTPEHEGKVITFVQSDGKVSNEVEIWTPLDLEASFKTSASVWWDPRTPGTIKQGGGRVASVESRFAEGPTFSAANSGGPDYSTVDGAPALKWPSSPNDRTLAPATAAPYTSAYWIIAARYRDGTATAFDGAPCLVGSGNQSFYCLGLPSNAKIASPWATEMRVNGVPGAVSASSPVNGRMAADLLPSGWSVIEMAGPPSSQTWAPGRQVGGSNRAWQGPLREAIGLPVQPTGDALARLQGYMAWRNGTAAKLPVDHPYKAKPPFITAPPDISGARLPLLTPGGTGEPAALPEGPAQGEEPDDVSYEPEAPISISNEPNFGAVAVTLPPIVMGERREIISGTPATRELALDPATGNLVYTGHTINGDSVEVTVRQSSVFPGQPGRDVVLTLPVQPAPFDLLKWPELITNRYAAVDAADGPVATFPAQGFDPRTAKQSDPRRRPTKTADGINFAANSGQHLTFGRISLAYSAYRGTLMIFRVDGSTGGAETILCSVNEPVGVSRLAGDYMPRIKYVKASNSIVASWMGQGPTGSTEYRVTAAPKTLITDGETWNVAFAQIREGRLYLNVNGVQVQGTTEGFASRFEAWEANRDSYLGFPTTTNSAWTLGSISFLQGELSETLVQRIVAAAMHSIGREADLPAGNPYITRHPHFDSEDFPKNRYHLDAQAWEKWKADTGQTDRTVNQGKPAVPPSTSFERVLLDDFRANTIRRGDATGTISEGVLFAPPWNSAIGAGARLDLSPGAKPNLYEVSNGTLKMSLAKVGNTWQAAAVSTVNNCGQGRTWSGPHRAISRFRWPRLAPTDSIRFFGCLQWSYHIEHLRWVTSERHEFDTSEPDGRSPTYLNMGASHVWVGFYAGKFGRADRKPDKGNSAVDSHKLYGGPMLVNGKKFNIFDGEYHEQELRVEDDWTYIIFDGVEVVRVPTTREYMRERYFLFNFVLHESGNDPDPAVVHSLEIDRFELWQKTNQIERVPGPFSARPTLSLRGGIISCDPNLPASASQREYHWYAADDYPLGITFTPNLTAPAVTSGVRCMVKAVGVVDAPCCWSARLA